MTREEFIATPNDMDSHRYLLWPALEETTGKIIEMGVGWGSTPFLHQYAKDTGRQLFSYENNYEWYLKFKDFESDFHKLIFTENFDDVFKAHDEADVIFMDHAPGERRKVDIELLAHVGRILCVHDSEPIGWNASDYQVRPLFRKFRYMLDRESESPTGAWTTLLSNTFDVTTLKP